MRSDKRVARLLSIPADYTFTEARALLETLGYMLGTKGKTSGSRVMFYRSSDGDKIMLHKPHPKDVLPKYAIRQLIDHLRERGDLDD